VQVRIAYADTPTSAIYTLSLHDALPICVSTTGASASDSVAVMCGLGSPSGSRSHAARAAVTAMRRRGFRYRSRMSFGSSLESRRSEEHTSELQSREKLVCRLLLEKKKHT